MANYVKSTNFYTKDALISGNPDKIVKGAEIDTEFNNIATAVASKADTTSPTFTGIPVAPTALAGTSTNQIATTAFVSAAIAPAGALYPIGSVYLSTESTNPFILFGFGTWALFSSGRMLMGAGGAYANGSTGGSADAIVVSHSHSASSTVTDPGHVHSVSTTAEGQIGAARFVNGSDGTAGSLSVDSATTGISVSTSVGGAGASGTNANLPPYIVVYMWNRTA